MLRDWFTPKRNSVWPLAKVNSCLTKLELVPDQQSTLDSGIHPDQWTLERSQAAQPFNAFKRELISSIYSQRQSSVILMSNGDYLAGHHHQIEEVMADAASRAFHPVRERDLFSLGPQNTVMGELDPAYQGSLFPDICLEQPELQSIMGDQVSQEVQNRILTAVRQTHDNNLEKLQFWDSKVRSLYSAASGLVNDGVETLRGYGRIQTALDVCLQSIMRRAGPFYKPPSSTSSSKPGEDRGSSCTVEPERYGNSVYFPITNKYLLFLDDVLSSNTVLEYT